ncbi:glutathione S-transferase family protein [Azospirillum sp. A39]|uniref:glutathione S-transferase family protein n=1 Tax=Azospirillum sp. A39 TaxID=3462279 RepID=UPI004045CD3F
MGLLIDGRWTDQWYDTSASGGAFVRPETQFRGQIRADGSTPYRPEPGRYHLYVSLACPWAHRTLIVRALKGLEDAVSVSVVDPLMRENGWELPDGADPVNGKRCLHEVYTAAKPDYSGRVTVPVLWDRQTGTIVNNESAEIMRMLNRAFDAYGDAALDLCPEDLRAEIDRVNAVVYDRVNNGVYKAGFATTQEKYEAAFDALFATLDELDARLADARYLVGNRLTEADWRLFTTLVRFDAVYFGHFKCNLRRIADYPHLSGYLRDLYQVPGVAATVNFDHIKRHYYASHTMINPTGIVPKGPALDLDAPHGRERLG